MLRVGLTGGIGCGKSTVLAMFGALGVPVFDADQIARELVAPGQPCLEDLAREFGDGVLVNGQLDRSALRKLIYADPESKKRLEAIMHPKVYEILHSRVQALSGPYCVLAIPLLLETWHMAAIDRVLVVDCALEQQYQRVARRDGLERSEVQKIIASQASREARLAIADDSLQNDGDLGLLHQQVGKLHSIYLGLTMGAS